MRSLLRPAGQKRSNTFDIYDMTENVWEWPGDWYDRYYYEEKLRSNPSGPSRGGDRVHGGGSYKDKAEDLRRGDQTMGFRLVFSARKT